ncbi:MAG TPA: hypothetical protein DCZ93_02900 [Elusimicrobia bacterium]|nr:hypothetical protein [Elusimicrobiota bacterium]
MKKITILSAVAGLTILAASTVQAQAGGALAALQGYAGAPAPDAPGAKGADISAALKTGIEGKDLYANAAELFRCGNKAVVPQPSVPVLALQKSLKLFTFRSSRYSSGTDAQEAMDYAVSGLKGKGYAVSSAVKEFDFDAYVYTIVFTMPDSFEIMRWHSLPYLPYSELKKDFKKDLEYYKSQGLVILDQNLKRERYVITVISAKK